jgi:Rrf2 family protein
MLTRTCELAVKALVRLAQEGNRSPVPVRSLARPLGCSPTYLSKTLEHLARAGIVESRRGAQGGVLIRRPLRDITLLEIVEASQGTLVGDFCDANGMGIQDMDRHQGEFCAFHQAMLELHQRLKGILGNWTLADLMNRPQPAPHYRKFGGCRMLCRDAAGPEKKR